MALYAYFVLIYAYISHVSDFFYFHKKKRSYIAIIAYLGHV